MKWKMLSATARSLIVFVLFGILPSAGAMAESPGAVVTYHMDKAKISQGEPVLLDVNIENPSSEQITLDLGANGNEKFVISIIKPDGETLLRSLPPRRGEGIVFFGGVQLEPKQAYEETLILNEWFEFGTTGTYIIEIGLKSFPASRLQIEVSPKDAAALAKRCSELLFRIQTATSAKDSLAAIQALGYIRDPVAVSSWESLLSRVDFKMTAINGLAAIGDSKAAGVLISRLDGADDVTRSSINNALETIARNTADTDLRFKIENATREKK
jgi:hypothetical protein